MANFTALGSLEFTGTPKTRVAVITQGNAEDFDWQVEYSLDAGTTWTPYEDDNDTPNSFTGSKFKILLVGTASNRVRITDLGTATSINIELG